jgi:hypothetical protein
MRYEICKAANGYMVIPICRDGYAMDMSKVWVFNTYQALCDKLPEILALTELK